MLRKIVGNSSVSRPPADARRHRGARPANLHNPSAARRLAAGVTALLLAAGVLPVVTASAAPAAPAPVGQGLTLNAGDMRFILKQIKIAENHATTEDAQGNPVPGQPLLGPGPNQIASPLLPYGLRTVDGSENNLVPDQGHYGSASLPFPRLGTPQWRSAQTGHYKSVNSNVTDPEPRFISNTIADQTPSNPAAIAAAGEAHRTVNNEPTAVPCTAAVTTDCVKPGETLDIPNVTTDFGLSAPYNGFFALFGQFFDHGVDFTKKTNNFVMIPLAPDDPLMMDGSAARAPFMVLNRAENQPGPDNILGTADDVQDATNTDSPWVDQSQTYASHSSHQVFLRDYDLDADARPVSNGKLIEGAAGGMATWSDLKAQAASMLGLRIADADIGNVPMLATDQYGRFLRGPNGLPQYITTADTLIEGNRGAPVAPPANVRRIGIAFLDDISHHAAPVNAQTGAALTADTNTAITAAAGPQDPGTYDDEMLNAHFVAGDGRVNENIGLTAVHQVFHSEHNRLVAYMQELVTSLNLDLDQWQLSPGVFNGERIFQAARYVTEMEYQHIVFEDFARKIQPGINAFNVFTQSNTGINPAVSAEFAHATYRFGHSMLTDSVDRTTNSGTDIGIPLLDAFLNPPAYYASSAGTLDPEAAAGAIAMGMTDQVGSELDEFVTDTLRNNVLGLPLDLATLNLARGRDTGVPSLNTFRRDLYRTSGESSLRPYGSWVEFGQALKHPDSVVNFMAAYGTHSTIRDAGSIDAKRIAAQKLFDMNPDPAISTPTDAYDFVNSTGTWANTGTTSRTGLDGIDLWIGGLAEAQNLFGGLLGSTFNYIFERQMTDLQDGDRLYYLSRTSGLNLRAQLDGNSMAELVMRNTDAKALKADVFGVADCEFEMTNIVASTGNNVADDPTSACDESALLLRMADGTIRYRARNSVDRPGLNAQSTYNGRDDAAGANGTDRIWAGLDNDTIWGNGGDDVIEGNDGADNILGGTGNDVITDSAGDDVIKAGPGNDAIDAGVGLDIVMGGPGDDFSNGGLNANQTFGDDGDDLIIAGDGPDTVFGGAGDDWQEGGNSNDLLQGDSGAPFFDDINNPGHDVLIGDSGEDDYDAEGGDDIMVAGPGIERNHGVYGFDWVNHARSVEAADSDMRMDIVEGPNALKDRFLLTEALSGWDKDDVLRGNDVAPSDPDTEVAVPGASNMLTAEGIARIRGLAGLLPNGQSEFGAGNIIIGGGGSDQIWGNGADDIIDGDKWLNVRLSVRTNPADPATEVRSATSLTQLQSAFLSTGPDRLDPGDVVIVREILDGGSPGDIDTAIFSGERADYDITTIAGVTTVAHFRGSTDDGTDTITNVERLRFTDQTVDLSAPTVIGRSPAVDAVNVATNSNVTVTFNKPVTGINATSFRLTNAAGTTVTAALSWNAATNTATLNPTGLSANRTYTARLSNGIRDLQGTPLQPTTWTFTTESGPAITAQTPAPDAVNVATNANVTITFSEPVTGINATSFRLTNAAGTTVAAALSWNAATRTATLNPSANLLTNRTYTVRLSTGIRDATGNRITAAGWNFSTEAGPSITGRAPTVNSANIAANSNVTVTFSEPVTGINATSFRLTNAAGTAVAAALSWNAATRTATLNPNVNLLTNRTYTVRLSTGIRDATGNPLPATSWNFSTESGPAVTAQTPGGNAAGIAANANVTVTFSEPVTGINATSFRLTNASGTAVTAALSWDAATNTATLNPSANLLTNCTYTVRLSTGIRDATGNPLPATSWNFSTASGPAVTAQTPAANATNIATGSNVTITFSGPVTGINATSFRLTNAAGTAVTAALSWDAATNTATLNPTGLLANRTYTARLSSGIRDPAANPLTARTWNFTTTGPPAVTARTPAANASGISRRANIAVTFNRAVSGISSSTFQVVASSGRAVKGQVTYNAKTRTATLNPRATQRPGSRYIVRLSGTIRDSAGKRLPASAWSYRTGR